MPKPKSGYKRQFGYQAHSGVHIEIKTEETYQKLKACAKGNGCTIGQWAESNIRYALTGQPYIPPYRHSGPASPTKRPRSFQLSEATFAWVESKVGEDKARQWIGKTLLSLAQIELTRQKGEQVEQEWRARFRI